MMISLIMTSADRIADLRRFFGSLMDLEINLNHVQLVFVNQGKYDPRAEFCIPEWLEYLEVSADRLSLSRARNIGLEHATGDIVGFPDDDCWYQPQLIKQIVEYFAKNPLVDAISTNVFDPDRQMCLGGRPLNVTTEIGFRNLFNLPISVGIFIRSPALDRIGKYFDESLGAGTSLGSGEETELLIRLLKGGSQVQYVGSIQVFHPIPEYSDAVVNKYYRYGLGFGFLNGRIARSGELSVLRYCCYVAYRSIGGCIANLHHPVERALYWGRLIGVLRGFWWGIGGQKGR